MGCVKINSGAAGYLLRTPFGEERNFSQVKEVVEGVKLDKTGSENVIFTHGSEKITQSIDKGTINKI